MTTGDIKNNLRKLQNELKLIQYQNEMDFEKMLIGLSAPFLPILHYVFTEYSCHLSSYFSTKGYDLYAKSDFRFLEIIYKILIQEFETKPMLTKQQFFSIGYPEMKVIFTSKIVSLCRQKHDSITKKIGKKKKRNTPAMKSCHSQSKQETDTNEDNTVQLGDAVVRGCIQTMEDKINNNDNMCIRPHNVTPPEYHIQPPKPNPELALSPVKSRNNEWMSGTYEEDEDEVKEIDSRLLDLTDIGEESRLETSVVEFIDIHNENSISLPEFKITKHSSNEENKLNTDDWLVSNFEPRVNKRFPDGHSLPANISVAAPRSIMVSKQNTIPQQCQQCQQCIMNSDMISTLHRKFEVMQSDIVNLTNVNNDLSAKVVLMETKLKIMESHSKDERNEHDMNVLHEEEHYTDNGYTENQDIHNTNNDFDTAKDVSKVTVPSVNTGISNLASVNPEKSYSPIKYTDDDIIVKDFKPIRMKDVHNMMNVVKLDDNKENEGIFNRIKKARKEPFEVKVVDDTHNIRDSTQDDCNDYDVDDIFTDSCNVSKLEDDFTEQAVRNVRRRLQETEDMLKNSGNYVK